ncbi:hypothetical protein [Acididesulfobacillus acetoxydans]|uniref:hypothetical protein n=1 Tax=Acididesulfobacillus acetoxydans TaxID=1561005 RepID=UPI001F107465|nr:hypothetical protein [Acididesulfobacillus acetoxydans]
MQKIDFPWHGNPDFQLQIGSNLPFRLASNVKNNGSIGINILDGSGSDARPYPLYGLLPDGNDGPKIVEMYDKIVKTLNPIGT